jgi:EF-P beta-lysylation protein EpmB
MSEAGFPNYNEREIILFFIPGKRTGMSATRIDIPVAVGRRGWQAELRDAVRDPVVLARLLELPAGSLGTADNGTPFPLLVPRAFVARMEKGRPDDPLLRQVLPTSAEHAAVAGFVPDPLEELSRARDGVIRKYAGRALLITTGACPVHCRYCFRREFPYAAQTAARADWQPALAAIRAGDGVREVILSGGDPLTLGNRRLARLIDDIETLPDITTLRIHTRFPIVLPSRIDTGLTNLLARTRLDTVVVLHANHPAEIDDSVAAAAARLGAATKLLLNQSVLLRGINDDASVLIALGERLRAIGVTPYYLHLLDRVAGTAHFDVETADAQKIVAEMRQRAPGYLVPRLVREIPGELSKTPFGSST